MLDKRMGWMLAVAAATVSAGGICFAAVSPDQAAKLGKSLTPWGAEAGASADGKVPAYTGEKPATFADEKPLFSVTAANAAQYDNLLSEGQKALLKKYPQTFRLDVYPTHRTQRYPDWFIQNTAKNATNCKSSADGLSLENCLPGVPFPIPKTGNEVMWNKALRYTAPAFEAVQSSFSVDAGGGVTLQGASPMQIQAPIFLPENRDTVLKPDSVVRLLRMTTTAPARKVGEGLVTQDFVDYKKYPLRAWQYLPGQRRVKLSPDLAYDTPNPQSAGGAFMDELYGFLGAQDRFDFKLVGKRELLVPANPYKYIDGKSFSTSKRFMKGHINPDALRFEVRRVWEVDATLKPGFRHAYKTRKIYIDEDSPGAGVAEGYDASGKPRRVQMNPQQLFIGEEAEGTPELNMIFDLQTGGYVVNGDTADTAQKWKPTQPKPLSYFTGDAMARSGVQ